MVHTHTLYFRFWKRFVTKWLPDIAGTRKRHGTARKLRNEKVVSTISAWTPFQCPLFLHFIFWLFSLSFWSLFLFFMSVLVSFLYSVSLGFSGWRFCQLVCHWTSKLIIRLHFLNQKLFDIYGKILRQIETNKRVCFVLIMIQFQSLGFHEFIRFV